MTVSPPAAPPARRACVAPAPASAAGTSRIAALIAAAALTLGGCASTPIDTEVAPDSPPPSAVAAAPDTATGQVLWGGVIVGSGNLGEQTQLEVLAYPLDRRQRPMTGREPEGRFLVLAEGYLETLDYAEGRLVTVLGALDGVRDGQVGEATRVYPAVRSEELHLWRGGSGEPERPRFTFGIGVNIGN